MQKACGVARYTWNWALAECLRQYEEHGTMPDFGALKKRWNQEKPAWVYESPRDANSQPFTALRKAYLTFFREWRKGNRQAGRPTFKKKGKCRDSFYVSNDRFVVHGLSVTLPVIGAMPMTEELRFAGKILHGTVSREADRWFLSVAVKGDFARQRTGDGIVGVDLGIKALATLSTGEVIAGPKPLRRKLKKLARLQRWTSRKMPGSQNRKKAAMKVARCYRRITNLRQDALHKLTTMLCRENQTVVIEDLNVRGMQKLRSLSRAVSDMGFHEFRRQLTYKAELYSTTLVIADRWYPSSKTCSCCGVVKADLTLADRIYDCPRCGVQIDRDLNAALNLRTLGQRETYACGHESAGATLVA